VHWNDQETFQLQPEFNRFKIFDPKMNEQFICRCCDSTKLKETIIIKEMQLGLREAFTYNLCNQCEALQIDKIPETLAKYYPGDKYYSFKADIKKGKSNKADQVKTEYLLFNKHKLLGSLLSIGYKVPPFYEWMKIPSLDFKSAILDVGTGNGALLARLNRVGFTNLTGIDPYIADDIEYPEFKVYKKDIFEVTGEFDYVMLHHSFEHMPDPLKVLKKLYSLLRPNRFALIRTPVMGMYSWKHYGVHWAGLDAPRHLIIHSIKSMNILAGKAGFKMDRVIFDTNPTDFIVSEQYKQDIPMFGTRSYLRDKDASPFSKADETAFKQLAKKIDAEGEGDQAAFYLYKS
jgi:2-polyprenyl-3-methyl-5-hydroxy-6-metoxy-1,4-benzoquinol methylase